jgi:hypothetical protein
LKRGDFDWRDIVNPKNNDKAGGNASKKADWK